LTSSIRALNTPADARETIRLPAVTASPLAPIEASPARGGADQFDVQCADLLAQLRDKAIEALGVGLVKVDADEQIRHVRAPSSTRWLCHKLVQLLAGPGGYLQAPLGVARH
jgi:hypothetical protein